MGPQPYVPLFRPGETCTFHHESARHHGDRCRILRVKPHAEWTIGVNPTYVVEFSGNGTIGDEHEVMETELRPLHPITEDVPAEEW